MKRSRGEEAAGATSGSPLVYPKVKLILILGFLAVHALNNASAVDSWPGDKNNLDPGTRAVFEVIVRDTGVPWDSIVDTPSPIVYRPLR